MLRLTDDDARTSRLFWSRVVGSTAVGMPTGCSRSFRSYVYYIYRYRVSKRPVLCSPFSSGVLAATANGPLIFGCIRHAPSVTPFAVYCLCLRYPAHAGARAFESGYMFREFASSLLCVCARGTLLMLGQKL